MSFSGILLDIFGGAFLAGEIILPLLGGLSLFSYALLRSKENNISYFEFVMLLVCSVLIAGRALTVADEMVEKFTFGVAGASFLVFSALGAITLFFILRDLIKRDKK